MPRLSPQIAAAAVALLGSPAAASAATIDVGDAARLTSALAAAEAGDTIRLADGTYGGHFVATARAGAGAPITVTGTRRAVLDGGGSGYGFHLDGAAGWRLQGFTIANAKKGVIGDGATGNVLDGVKVHRIADEAIHLRCASSDNVIQRSEISDTGLVEPRYGEGVYFGSAQSNWGTCPGGGPDRSDRNKAIGNVIGPNVRAESADLKEGSTGGQLLYNVFDGTGMSGQNAADSWVDAKGNGYVIAGNRGSRALADGFQSHQVLDGWGERNVFTGNIADVSADGYGFNIDMKDGDARGNVVCADNTVRNAGKGVANIRLTAACPVSVPPPSTPPGPPAGADAAAPRLSVRASGRQARSRRGVRVRVRVNEPATLSATATARARGRTLRSRLRSVALKANRWRTVRIRPGKVTYRRIRSALRRHTTLRVRVSLRVRDAARNTTTRRRTVKLRR